MDEFIQRRLVVVETRLDVEFKNRALLLEALTHRSYLNECRSHPTGHNERLEFVGDAVIEIVVTDMLYRTYPDMPEGELTRCRSALVRAETLGPIAKDLGLHTVMFFSKGQLRINQADDAHSVRGLLIVCANVFEAVVGALYIDQGLGSCRFVLDHLLHVRMQAIIAENHEHKNTLQEEVQKRWGHDPRYEVLKEEGVAHQKHYTIGCFIDDVLVGVGTGISKKEAQTAAAKTARETIHLWEGRIAEAVGSDSAMRRSGKRGQA